MQRRKKNGKGKAKPRKMRRAGYELDALPRTGKFRMKTIGSSQPIPTYKFFRDEYRFQQVVNLSGFAVHTGNTGDTIASAAGTSAGAMAWSIGDLSQVTSFSNLFDQYRLVHIDLHIKWYLGSTISGASLFIVVDFDDSVVLGSAAAAQAYQSCQELRPGDSLIVRMQPVTQTVSTAGAMLIPSPWLDFATTSNQHRGIKWFLTAGVGNSWIVDAQYTFECYTVR